MVEGRDAFSWSVASSVMALIANCNRDPKRKRKPFTAEEFNPTIRKKKKAGILVTAETKEEFREDFAFLRERKNQRG